MASLAFLQKAYLAYFGRPVDAAGLASFGGAVSELAVQSAFFASAESQALYGTTFGATQINAIYQMLFNRAAEPAGLAYWTNEVARGALTPAGAALGILNGALNADVVVVNNKLTASAAYSAAVDTPAEILAFMGDAAAAKARAFLASVTTTVPNAAAIDASVFTLLPVVVDAPDPITTTFTLTVGADTLVGTALNDTFNATSTTLTAVDSIDGAGGIDTLNLTTAGTYTLSNGANITNVEILNLANGTNTIIYNTSAGFTTINGGTGDDTIIPNTALLPLVINGGMGTDTIVLPAAYAATASGSGTFATNVTNFEKLRLTDATNQTIDLQTLGNYSDVSFSGANGLTLINLPSNGKLTLTGAGTAVSIFNTAFAGGVNDIVNLTLTDGSTSGVAFATVGITASGVETANISVNDTQGTPTGAFNDTVTWLGNSVKTINVSGNAGLTLSASSTALTTVDASGITLGGFTWTASALTGTATVKGSATGTNTVNMNSATAGVNYTGGSGNDNAVLNATVSSTAALGNGNNSLALNGVTILGTYTAGTGTDSLAFYSATPNLSNATITGFENLTVVNNANITATLAQMAQFTGFVNAAGTETLNLTTAGTFTAFSTIETYNLANGTNNFTSANVAVTVVGGTGSDTFNFTANQIINFLTSVDGGNGTDTLNIGAITANLNLMALVSNIETINAIGSAAVGYTFTNVNGAGVVLNFAKGASADVVQLGSGGQTLNVLGTNGTAITIAGGSGADTINLSATGVGSETIRSGSVNTAIDTVANFNASGTDYFKTGVNAASVVSHIIGNADTATYLATINNGLSPVLNNTGQAYLITIQTGTAAGTYLFQNTGADTSQFDATDFFVQLTGTIGTISTANLIA